MQKKYFTIERTEDYQVRRVLSFGIDEEYAKAMTEDFYESYRFTDRLNLPIPITVQDIYDACTYNIEDNEFLNAPVERTDLYYSFTTTVADVIRDYVNDDIWNNGDIVEEEGETSDYTDRVVEEVDEEEGED